MHKSSDLVHSMQYRLVLVVKYRKKIAAQAGDKL